MGGGSWVAQTYATYSVSKGRSVGLDGSIVNNCSTQEMFTQRKIAPELSPYSVMRECCDTDEHPNTVPVILALDVTGSMGGAAVEVAKKLNVIMTELYGKVQDVEFLIMGIGDLSYDTAPIQASQFESDIRIAEQLDKVYFEGGGGGNACESYTAAWYFGARHCNLDCWKRGRKGIIITLGDEPLNPYLPKNPLAAVTGDKLQADVETKDLYEEVSEKFDVYHLAVNDKETSYCFYKHVIEDTFGEYLDEQHLQVVTMDNLVNAIINIVSNSVANDDGASIANENREIAW